MTNISTNNTQIILTIGVMPIEITHFSAENDPWVSANEPERGDAQMTPDGKMVVWAKNDLIQKTLTLSSGSPEAKNIMNAFQSQSRNGAIPAVLLPITAIVKTDKFTSTYTEGVMSSGNSDYDIGATNLLDLKWTFKFARVITIHN